MRVGDVFGFQLAFEETQLGGRRDWIVRQHGFEFENSGLLRNDAAEDFAQPDHALIVGVVEPDRPLLGATRISDRHIPAVREAFLVLVILIARQKIQIIEKQLNLREHLRRDREFVDDLLTVLALKTELALPGAVEVEFLNRRREPRILEKVAVMSAGGRAARIAGQRLAKLNARL